MATAQDIIQDAFEKLGLYAPGETINAADGARGLTVLNDMMDSWSNESLTCFAIKEQHVTFTPGVFSYTIGPGGAVNDTRPLRLIDTPGSCYILDTNGNQYGVDVITQAQWNMRGSRNTNSNFPDVLFYDPQFPLGVLNFDPIPNIGYTAYFDSYLQLSDFTGLTSQIILPPGYKRSITFNLCIDLKPYYSTAVLDPDVREQAAISKADIKRTNLRPNTAVFDPEILSKAPGIYSIQTDSYRR